LADVDGGVADKFFFGDHRSPFSRFVFSLIFACFY
jgi:hypothetical protein